MTELPGRIGEWDVLGELGVGDFARVYDVTRDDVAGALKQCTAADADKRERFRIELDALGQLSHEAIPGIIDADADAPLPYFVMTKAPGRSLLSLIEDWKELGRVFGEVEALVYIRQILDALRYMHSLSMVHRDIKDANVIIDTESSTATLIDFGFCKRSGTRDIRLADSFWRAGAARFAPPAKLHDPALAVALHDVFAVGVLGYRMLTGMFPWAVESEGSATSVRDSMENDQLVPASTVNSQVSPATSRFLTRLLTIDDDSRPTSQDAVVEADEILALLRGSPKVSTPDRKSGLIFKDVIRDDLYGDVRLTDLEFQVLNTREMQRLRYIKQLGMTNIVYPGADHTRFSHSIGTLDRVETMMRAIEDQTGVKIELDTRRVARLYALTHDVAHIPMGHTIEDELGILVRHDENLQRFINLVDCSVSELGKILGLSDVGRAVISILNPSTPDPADDVVYQAVSGVVGADVVDYINRDSVRCGLDHRVDTALFRQLRLHERARQGERRLVYQTSGKFGMRVDRKFAVEMLLAERYALFLKVYTHSTKIAADAVLGKALTEMSSPRGRAISDDTFTALGDEGLLALLESSRKPYVKELGRRLRYRALPTAVYRALLLADHERTERGYQDMGATLENKGFFGVQGRAAIETELGRRSGVDRNRLFFYCPRKAPGYRRAEHWEEERMGLEPPIRREPDHGSEFAARHLGLWEAWVFVAEPTREEWKSVASASAEFLGFPNVVRQNRRISIAAPLY
ncbi:protein kinase [uncultured Jatrophihabitans sp.]|uniref:protein kinase domain-containing protein n=1 Tax=uncultured Jatrophihabitans sp. TaxID=1610747 RepID=UPI0035CB9F2F